MFFCAGGDDEEGGVGDQERLESFLVNYNMYLSLIFKNPSPWHSPPLVPCVHVPVPPTLGALVAPFPPSPLELDTHIPETLD